MNKTMDLDIEQKKLDKQLRIFEMLVKVEDLLARGEPADALKQLTGYWYDPWVRNALGVCQLRLGRFEQAIKTLRDLVLTRDGQLRDGLPMSFQLNYATAVLLGGDIGGCEAILKQLARSDGEQLEAIRLAIRKWKELVPIWKRFSSKPNQLNVRFDGHPGVLELCRPGVSPV